MSSTTTAAVLVAFPVAAGVGGAAAATLTQPGPRLRSAVQHFAAGLVFAAVAGEVLPDLRRQDQLPTLIVGFVAGVVLLIGLSRLEQRSGTTDTSTALPFGLVAAVAIDLIIDGILVGLGVTLGQAQGRILTIALTLEVLFLALSVNAELQERGVDRRTAAMVPAGLSLIVAAGAVPAAALLGDAPKPLLGGILAFGAAALLYLVTEELLTEAHAATAETPALTAMFFVGFLSLYVLEGVAG